MLAAQEDNYDGIIIDHQRLPTDPQEFGAALQQSLQVCECVEGGRGSTGGAAILAVQLHFRSWGLPRLIWVAVTLLMWAAVTLVQWGFSSANLGCRHTLVVQLFNTS
jgi:hypothetical protein